MARRARFWEREAQASASARNRRVLALVGTFVVHLLLLAVLLMPVQPMQPRERMLRSSVDVPDTLTISSVGLSDQPQAAEAMAAERKQHAAQASPVALRPRPAALRADPQTEARSLLTEGRGEQARIGEFSLGEQQSADLSDPTPSTAPALLVGAPTDEHASGMETQTASLASGNGGGTQGNRSGRGKGKGNGGLGVGQALQANCRRVPYPEMAKARGWQGRVEIEVKLDDQGSLLSAAIAKSSGHQLLDRVALQWARRCEYTAPPIVAGNEAVANVPVTFRLRGISTGEFMVRAR